MPFWQLKKQKTMKQYFISQNKKQYRANLHSHSTLSDGMLSPEELKRIYREHGYSILAITDHEHPKSHAALSEPDFLMLTGYEAYIRTNLNAQFDRYEPEVHLNLFAKDPHNETMICFNDVYCKYINDPTERATLRRVGSERPREYSVAYVNEFIRTAVAQGYLVSYNHPVWSMEDEERVLSYENIFSLEIQNYSSYRQNGIEYSGALYDKMLRRRKKVFCHAGDDNHNKAPLTCPRSDSFGSFTMILADDLSYDSVIEAMETGEMYASEGPLLHEISMEDGVVHIECSPAKRIILYTGSKAPKFAVSEGGKTISSADLKLDPIAPYFRVAVIDEEGKIASSRGFFRSEFQA